MTSLFDVPMQILLGQLLLGLINGIFYAAMSLGLAIIFGMLNIINFTHGALFMLGAFVAWILLNHFAINYWWALVIAPIVVGLLGILLERLFIRRVYDLDHSYGLLLTYGLALALEGTFRKIFGSSGLPYRIPPALSGATDLDFMMLPHYRAWVLVIGLIVSLSTWFLIEKTSLGARLRAATENPMIVRTFGINVRRLITLTYGAGVALAAFAGVLAAPIYSVNPNMGEKFVVIGFAVVVIGGMGSVLGSIVIGIALGVIEGLTNVIFPQASSTVIFVVMTIVLLTRPAGLFGKAA
jgi:branched-chain amino acid transport system permease protein